MTFFFKFVFPLLWVCFVGFFILHGLIVGADLFINKIPIFSFLIAISVLIFWLSVKIKGVEIDYPSKIYISDYRKVIEVRLQNIKSISGSVFFIPELVWFTLNKPCVFGRKIIFIPQYRFFKGFSVHPMAKELKELVKMSHIVKDSNGE